MGPKDRCTIASLLVLIVLICRPLHAEGPLPSAARPQTLRLQVQMGSPKRVGALQASPDGKLLMTTSELEDSLDIWDIHTGKLLRTFADSQRTGTATFSSDGRAVFMGAHSSVEEWDIAAGTLLGSYRGLTGVVKAVVASPTGKRIAAGGSAGSIAVWDVSSREAPQMRFEGMTEGTTVTALHFYRDGIRLLAGYSDGRIVLWSLATKKKISTCRQSAGRIDSIDVSPDERRVLCLCPKKPVEMWDVASASLVRSYSIEGAEIEAICFSSDGASIFGGSMNGIAVWESATGRVASMFQSMEVMPWTTALAVIPGANMLAAVTQGGMKVDLLDSHLGTVIRSIDVTHIPDWRNTVLLPFRDGKSVFASSNNGPRIWSMAEARPSWTTESSGTSAILGSISPSVLSEYTWIVPTPDEKAALMVRDKDGGAQVELRELGNGELKLRFDGTMEQGILSIVIAPNGLFLAVGTSGGTIRTWNMMSGAVLKDMGPAGEEGNGAVTALAFSADEQELFAGTSDGFVQVWDIGSGQLRRSFRATDGVNVNCIAASPDARTILVGKSLGGAELWNASTGALMRVFGDRYDGINCAQLSPDGKFALLGSESGLLAMYNSSSGELLKLYHGHEGRVTGLACSPDGAVAYSIGDDGTIRRWDLATGAWVAFLLHGNGRDWLIFTDDGYWDGSPGCNDMLAMVNGLDVYNIDQFAARNNRPDIILQRLGSTDTDVIQHYYRQYLKRLRRLGLTEEQLSFDLNSVPEARITPASQDGRSLIVKVKLDGKGSRLKSWNLWVNDVPLFGAAGKAIDGVVQEQSETILLNPGDNKIETGCMNGKGIDAFRASVYARWEGEVQPRLYYIGFGISAYKSPDLTLGYAAIDARDLAAVWQSMNGRGFSQVIARTWTDAEVTPENIKKAKLVLSDARPEDTVVLFIAGHGVHDLDKESTYYYVTYDTAIDDLEHTAANFELIEDLLQGVAPRNKLFLMDTCESGELDDVQGAQGPTGGARGIRSRALPRETALRRKAAPTVNEAITQKERWIYNDILRRSGAVVFSSCRGNEASWEFDDLKNGAFTAAIKRCFLEGDADANGDGVLSLREIETYVADTTHQTVYDRVIYSATHGEQHPTVDRDNLSAKFGFPSAARY